MKKTIFLIAISLIVLTQKAFCANIGIENIRFFEAGYTVPSEENLYYKDSFPRSSSRYIYCRIDYKNNLYQTREHNVRIVWQYYNPDASFSGQVESDITVYPEWYSNWTYHGWGWDEPGNWPIGTYTVKILADGEYIGEKRFSIYNDIPDESSEDGSSDYLYNAVLDNDVATLKDVLSKGADPNATNMFGMYALNTAANDGKAEIVKILLDNGADINSADYILGWTPLICAANNGNNEISTLLIQRGASIDAEDTAGYTALIYAATAAHDETVKLLIASGANINHIAGGYTPLISTVSGNHYETARLLLENNAEPNAKMETGETSLILAIQKGNLELVKLLLNYGADLNIKDNKNRGALEWAEFEQHKDIIELLKKTNALDINGSWEGVWTDPTGYIYLLKINLNIKDPNNIETVISWTLNASPLASEQSKIGLKATEYVKGSYDSSKRTLNLEGHKEKDEHDIIGLDKYKLVVALDGAVIRGLSENNGTWTGKLSANQVKNQNVSDKIKQLWNKIKQK